MRRDGDGARAISAIEERRVNRFFRTLMFGAAIVGSGTVKAGLRFDSADQMNGGIVAVLKEHGDVRHGSLGIALQDLTTPPHDKMPLAHWNGLSIVMVDRQSTADHAGLKSGDLVVEIDSVPVQNALNLRANLALLRIGEVAELMVLRE